MKNHDEFELDDAEERRVKEEQAHARRQERLSKRQRREDAEDYTSQKSRPERAPR